MRERERKVPNMKEIGEVTHLEVEVDGFGESTIGIDMKAINPWVRQLGPWRWLSRVFSDPPTGGADIFLPKVAGSRRRRRRGRETHEA